MGYRKNVVLDFDHDFFRKNVLRLSSKSSFPTFILLKVV